MKTGVSPLPLFWNKFSESFDWEKNQEPDFTTLRPTHKVKFWWKCEEGHSWEALIGSRWNGAKKPIKGCPECAKKNYKRTLDPEKTLLARFPELAAQWSPDNEMGPDEVAANYSKPVKWVCERGHEWEATPNLRVRRPRCSQCIQEDKPTPEPKTVYPEVRSSKTQKVKNPGRVRNGILTVEHPELLQEWDFELNEYSPYELTSGSGYRAHWKCHKGHKWQAIVFTRANGNSCAVCAVIEKPRYVSVSIADKFPLLLEEWSTENDESPKNISFGSEYRAKWKCSTCQHEWSCKVCDRTRGRGCPRCSKKISKPEVALFEFVRDELGFADALQGDRKAIRPLELDIYVPSKHVAIEYNGVYWHSEKMGKDSKYHYNKWKSAQDQGIDLVTIWEDDWNRNPELVKRMIAHKLGRSQDRRVYARLTNVVSVDVAVAREFLEENHIQGFVRGSLYLGLEWAGELIALAVFQRANGFMYLQRYATSCHVIGGLGKILSVTDGDIVTFANLEVSNGGLYEKLGFIVDKELDPDYSYVYFGTRVHKFNFRLKRFRDDPSLVWQDGLSERELALLNGIPRVWDSGKIRYVLKR